MMGISKAMVLILLMMRRDELNASALTPIDRQLIAPAKPSNAPVPAVTHLRPSHVETLKPTQQTDYKPPNVILAIYAIVSGSIGSACIFMICCSLRKNNRREPETHPTLIQPLLEADNRPLNGPVASQVKSTGGLDGDSALPVANPVKQTTDAVGVMALK